MWLTFLESPLAYSRPFLDFDSCWSATEMDWYTDAAKSAKRGFSGYHKDAWFAGKWQLRFIKEKDPSISYLELYTVTVGVVLWAKNYAEL